MGELLLTFRLRGTSSRMHYLEGADYFTVVHEVGRCSLTCFLSRYLLNYLLKYQPIHSVFVKSAIRNLFSLLLVSDEYGLINAGVKRTQ